MMATRTQFKQYNLHMCCYYSYLLNNCNIKQQQKKKSNIHNNKKKHKVKNTKATNHIADHIFVYLIVLSFHIYSNSRIYRNMKRTFDMTKRNAYDCDDGRLSHTRAYYGSESSGQLEINGGILEEFEENGGILMETKKNDHLQLSHRHNTNTMGPF